MSITPRPRIGDHSSRRLSDEIREEIVNAFGDNPQTSQRRVSASVGVSVFSVNKVLKEENIRPYKRIKVQQLLEDDNPKRLKFCQTVTSRQEQDCNFINNLVFSDEATFHLSGSMNMPQKTFMQFTNNK